MPNLLFREFGLLSFRCCYGPGSATAAARIAFLMLTALLLGTTDQAASARESVSISCESGRCESRCCKPCDGNVGADDDLWIISSRTAGCAVSGELPKLRFWRRGAAGYWKASSWSKFLESDDAKVPTRIWAHGNRIGFQESIDIGFLAHRHLVGIQPGAMRFVIWSWPSERTRGPLRDVRAKAMRTESESYFLACLIRKVDDNVPIHLIGYSYGSRILSGALHILGGGNLGPLALKTTPAKKRDCRAVLFAPALHNDWLLPGGYHGRAMVAASKLLSTFNSCDRTLRWYHLVEKCGRPQALGFTGQVNAESLGEKFHEVDMTDTIGRIHYWKTYLYSPTAMAYARGIFEISETRE